MKNEEKLAASCSTDTDVIFVGDQGHTIGEDLLFSKPDENYAVQATVSTESSDTLPPSSAPSVSDIDKTEKTELFNALEKIKMLEANAARNEHKMFQMENSMNSGFKSLFLGFI